MRSLPIFASPSHCLLPLALLLAAGPALAARPADLDGDAAARHGYVLGRYAAADADLAAASRYFDLARARDPGAADLLRRSFELALAAGDRPRATSLAAQLEAAGQGSSDTALVRLVDAVLRKDWVGVDAARAGLVDAGYASVVAPIVEAWTLFGRGRSDAALAKLDPAAYSGFARAYVAEQRAHMLAGLGRFETAARAYAELRAGTGSGINILRQGEADAVAAGGNREAALKLLAGDDPGLAAARRKLERGQRIGALAPDPRRGIGWMAARLAADLSRDKPVPLALLFARAGSFLAPDIPATWLITGDVLAKNAAREPALAAYAQVPAGDGLAEAAAARRTELLEALGRQAEAGKLLTAATASPDARPADWQRLGDWHRRADRFADAGAAYGRALALAGPDASWTLYFLRGSMAERSGNWPAAEADLREALRRSPDEPMVLNYLGYSMLDRGAGDPAEAAALVERAAKLRPGDGGILDSLGWSQFARGRYVDAVTTLEKAALLEPGDPTIVGHLGDAYWQVGRRIEARFRWRAALDLDPEPAQRQGLAARLDYGLDAAPAMTAATAAANDVRRN